MVINFVEQMEIVLAGCTPQAPLRVPLKLYAELSREPEIAHLMERIAVKPEDWRDAQCNGKERFASMQQARKVTQRYADRAKPKRDKNQRFAVQAAKRVAYACSLCGGFHIGTSRNNGRKM